MLGHLKSARRKLEEEGHMDEDEENAKAIHQATKEKDMLLLQQRLEGHYVNMKNFIRTQAEPTIFYLPAKHTPATQQALDESQRALEQKIRSLRGHLHCPAEDDDEPDHYGGRRDEDEEEEEGEEEEQEDEEEEEEGEEGSSGEDSG